MTKDEIIEICNNSQLSCSPTPNVHKRGDNIEIATFIITLLGTIPPVVEFVKSVINIIKKNRKNDTKRLLLKFKSSANGEKTIEIYDATEEQLQQIPKIMKELNNEVNHIIIINTDK